EWIMQLCGEIPAHIIMPALHKTKEECADIIGREIGHCVPPEYQPIVRAARKRLRQEFIHAGVGISGVNFGVAETGTLMIVTNEGNGRLVTSAPRVHIAVMGLEKVVPSLDDAIALLRVLARSATGQKMTSCVSFLHGPRRTGEIDGPEELHLVL